MTERMHWQEIVRRLRDVQYMFGAGMLPPEWVATEDGKNWKANPIRDLARAAADEIAFLRKLTGAVSQGESHADIKARIKSGG